MNKSDKTPGAVFRINAQVISDDELEGVAGGNQYTPGHPEGCTCDFCRYSQTHPDIPPAKHCPKCGISLGDAVYDSHVASCTRGTYVVNTTQNS